MATEFNPIDYWEARHADLKGDHRNVGNKKLSSQENLHRICSKAIRVGHHLGLLGVPSGAHVLDAGCGAGVVSGLLADAGFRVTGVDCSPSAIVAARERVGATFETAALSDFRLARKFAAVLCLDVLYHVVDDAEWERSLANLAAHVDEGGFLVLVEYFEGYGKKSAEHVRWRSERHYADVLHGLGFELLPSVTFSYA